MALGSTELSAELCAPAVALWPSAAVPTAPAVEFAAVELTAEAAVAAAVAAAAAAAVAAEAVVREMAALHQQREWWSVQGSPECHVTSFGLARAKRCRCAARQPHHACRRDG